MDAMASFESRLTSCRVTGDAPRLPWLNANGLTTRNDSNDAALRHATAHERVIEIFKKTSCVAGLRPGGRYVAKDMYKSAGIIEIAAPAESLNAKLTGEDLAELETKRTSRATNHTSGGLWKYAQHVGPAVDGAVTHSGGAYEKQCHADI